MTHEKVYAFLAGCQTTRLTPLPLPLQLCCSSPERFLHGSISGVLEARPIKGTAPRSEDPAADAAAAADLAASEKDRAENLMIVDPLRNDLGRVCEVSFK